MRMGTLYVNESGPIGGEIILPSLDDNIIHFSVTGNIRVIHTKSTSSRRLLADTPTILNANANDASVAIAIRFGSAGLLTLQATTSSNTTSGVFNSLQWCNNIDAIIDYNLVDVLQTVTMISCTLPYGVSKSLSFSLW